VDEMILYRELDGSTPTQSQSADAAGLAEGLIRVWRASLAVDAARFSQLMAHLSDDESARAGRYRIAAVRRRFVVARGLLRELLGQYLGTEPADLRFCSNHHGKPALDHPAVAGLEFNLSHSESTVLYGVAQDSRVGVDIERVRPVANYERLAERFYTPAEHLALQAVPRYQRQRAFLTGWVRKEAYMKARGLGFCLSPRRFAVTLEMDRPPSLLFDLDQSGVEMAWRIIDLPVGSNYVAALACTG
jgi:4'-phosphopantetheinyl transferase